MDQLHKHWNMFREASEFLQDNEQDAEVRSTLESEFEAEQIKLEELQVTLGELRTTCAPRTPPQSPGSQRSTSPNQSISSNVNYATPKFALPKLDFAPFTGNYEEWSTFKDIFMALIHKNPKLEGVTKFQYLLSKLEDKPKSLLSRIPVITAEYEGALAILTERYENRKIIVFEHLRNLLDLKQVTHGSSDGLRNLLDTMTLEIRSLSNFNFKLEDNDYVDVIFCYLAIQRLDPKTYELWNMATEDKELPKWEELRKFIERRCRDLESRECSKGYVNRTDSSKPDKEKDKIKSKCVLCQEPHWLFKCAKYSRLSLQEKQTLVYRNKLCSNCLRTGHKGAECKTAQQCRECSRPHHTSLHDFNFNSRVTGQRGQGLSQTTLQVTRPRIVESTVTLLPTAIVRVLDSRGRYINCRALLDQGSQVCCITEECVTRLGLSRKKANSTLHGIGGDGNGKVKGKVDFDIKSMFNNFSLNIEALVLPKLTGFQPQLKMETKHLAQFHDLQFADPNWFQPGRVDILLDAGVYAVILRNGFKRHKAGTIAQDTELGWILSGGSISANTTGTTCLHLSATPCSNVEAELRKFLAIEEVPDEKISNWTKEETECNDHFVRTHTRDETGRFIVRLPFNPNVTKLGESKKIAFRRLIQTERRLDKWVDKRREYIKFMSEYEGLNHMHEVSYRKISDAIYLPHHFVEKIDSTTTKLRVVFDASCKTETGTSLNDTLMTGPKIQDDLIPLIIRFRCHRIGLTADVEKMFRQIKVHPADRKFQHILWREDSSRRIRDYELDTVTYGTASAPFLATKCILQLSEDEKHKFPLASIIAAEDAFMDDVVTGAATIEEATALQDQLVQLYKAGGFLLRKFMSNNSGLLRRIPPELRALDTDTMFDTEEAYKTLGISWDFRNDKLYFKIPELPPRTKITKRTVSSDIARTFDPLSWISPFVIRAKILLQKLWSEKMTWDEQVPHKLRDEWLEYRTEIGNIKDIKINRCVLTSLEKNFELHGFADASSLAIAAVIYVVSEDQGKKKSSILISKTKVAPLQLVTIPRLELCAAALLAKLFILVKKALITKRDKGFRFTIKAYTDSTAVLGWLDQPSKTWKTYVANRVATIQKKIPGVVWSHVKSQENPADFASRGQRSIELSINRLWWEGPLWLLENQSRKGQTPLPDPVIVRSERKKALLAIKTYNSKSNENFILTKFSSLTKLVSVSGYVFRFVNCCLKRISAPTNLILSVDERNAAMRFWVKWVQEDAYLPEITSLTNKGAVTSGLASLSPYLDENRVLRVGGRLNNAKLLNEMTRHPIILPKDSYLSKLIVRNAHEKTLHGGPTLVLATIRQNYWIQGVRDLISRCIHKCIVCVRYRAAHLQPIMGDLPASRVTPSPAFTETGVDYAGPISVKTWKGRGFRSFKGYICLFVCLSTRAIHLEAVSDLTTDAFLAAMERFISVRGRPSCIWSDNGSNFIGAERELRELFDKLQDDEVRIADSLAKDEIRWIFSPPYGPHFGGIWESGIKSTKSHLKKVFGKESFTFEELDTVLKKISACLNSRPIYPMSSVPDDIEVLTPGHFLIGRPLNAIPNPDVTQFKWNRLDRWQKLQRLTQEFWILWKSSYILELQKREKWNRAQENIKTGEFVILHDENERPANWKMGRVLKTIPGKDGVVRLAVIQTARGQYIRPVIKLSILPFLTQDESM